MRISDWSSDVCSSDLGQREFWYFLSVDRLAKLAVRYRPVLEDGEAIVRVAMLCEDTEAACERLQAAFMQGLPFAKARISEERRVGKACVSPWRSRWSPYH